jgi:glutamate:Na+ symporter, ESS family
MDGVAEVALALAFIAVLLVAGAWIRSQVAALRKLFLPSSVIAGVLGLFIGPGVLGSLAEAWGGPAWLADGLIPPEVLEVWSELPVLLISVVFAGLFLGKEIPGIRRIWRLAGPQVSLGQSIAWGQYVVGIILGIAVLSPLFGMDPIAGALIEIGFEGGHGTAAGLAPVFEEFGFSEGADLALGLATVGLVSGVLIGMAIINWAIRTGRIDTEQVEDLVERARSEGDDLDDIEGREPVIAEDDRGTEPLSIHLGLIAMAVGIGWLMLQAFIWVEQATWGGGDEGLELFVHVPLFPLAMVGGVVLQLVLDRVRTERRVDRGIVNQVTGTALDFIIVAALATLSLEAIGGNLGPFVILAAAGIVWNVFAFLYLAPRIVPEYPYQRGLGDFGQSTGMTVTGLLLLRVADPGNRSGGMEAFGYKQLLFEPVVGGGLFTAMSVPLIAQLGPLPVLGITLGLFAFWVVLGMRRFGSEAS